MMANISLLCKCAQEASEYLEEQAGEYTTWIFDNSYFYHLTIWWYIRVCFDNPSIERI